MTSRYFFIFFLFLKSFCLALCLFREKNSNMKSTQFTRIKRFTRLEEKIKQVSFNILPKFCWNVIN